MHRHGPLLKVGRALGTQQAFRNRTGCQERVLFHASERIRRQRRRGEGCEREKEEAWRIEMEERRMEEKKRGIGDKDIQRKKEGQERAEAGEMCLPSTLHLGAKRQHLGE